jgi:hypothetical protein
MNGIHGIKKHGLVALGKPLIGIVPLKELVGRIIVPEGQNGLCQSHGGLKRIVGPVARMAARLLVYLHMEMKARVQGPPSCAFQIIVYDPIVLVEDKLMEFVILVFVQGCRGSCDIISLLEEQPVILHMDPIGGSEFLKLVPDDVHALAMPPLLRSLQNIFKERKGGGHGNPIRIRGVVIHAQKIVHLVQISPAFENGIDRLFKEIPALTGSHGQQYSGLRPIDMLENRMVRHRRSKNRSASVQDLLNNPMMPRIQTGPTPIHIGHEVLAERQGVRRQLLQKKLKIREEVSGPPVACCVLSLKDDFITAGPHFPVFHTIRHNDHIIGEKELVFGLLDKEFLGNRVLEEVILIIVLDKAVIGHGHLGLTVNTIIPDKTINPLYPCCVVFMALHEPVKSLLGFLLRFMNLKELNTGIIFFLMPIIQGQHFLIELNGLILVYCGVIAICTVIGIAFMNGILGLLGFIERLF